MHSLTLQTLLYMLRYSCISILCSLYLLKCNSETLVVVTWKVIMGNRHFGEQVHWASILVVIDSTEAIGSCSSMVHEIWAKSQMNDILTTWQRMITWDLIHTSNSTGSFNECTELLHKNQLIHELMREYLISNYHY